MYIEIDFNSEEALYIQLRNQIIYGIATRQYKEGDELPSVRQLAETIGINMHTVNKAYAVLRQEGLLWRLPAGQSRRTPGQDRTHRFRRPGYGHPHHQPA